MSAALIKDELMPHLEHFRDVVNELVVRHGDKEAECQQVCILNRLRGLEMAINGLADEDIVRHPLFYIPLTDVEEAKRLFDYLHAQGIHFHPDDDPRDVDSVMDVITRSEALELDHRMSEAGLLEWQEYDSPAGYCLSINPVTHDT